MESGSAEPAKEKLSRLAKSKKKKERRRRKILLWTAVIVLACLAAGAFLNIPYINAARRAGDWLGERLFGSPSGETSPPYAFLVDPGGGRELAGKVDFLFILYRDDSPQRTLLGLSLFTYDTEEGRGEFYLLPEELSVFDVEGREIPLREALAGEGGYDLVRSTAENLAGDELDYTVMLGFKQAVTLLQGLGFPPVEVAEDTVLVNPLNGETNYLFAGHRISDADRLLFFLMATDEGGDFSLRRERLGDYLPGAMQAVAAKGGAAVVEALSALPLEEIVRPSAGDREAAAEGLASLVQALADLGEGSLAFRNLPRVEVLNGCGVPDLGRKVADELASKGVRVSDSTGNAKVVVNGEEVNDFSHQTSLILYRSSDEKVAAFADYLSVLLSVGEVKYEPGPGSEVVLVAGRDLASALQ